MPHPELESADMVDELLDNLGFMNGASKAVQLGGRISLRDLGFVGVGPADIDRNSLAADCAAVSKRLHDAFGRVQREAGNSTHGE